MRRWRDIPEEERIAILAELKAARQRGPVNWTAIQASYNVDRDTLQYQCDPVFRGRLLARNIASRNARKGRTERPIRRSYSPWLSHPAPRVPQTDLMIRRAEIPADTRSLTGLIFGDPIPGDLRRNCG